MTQTHEVISAFLDDEPFDANDLAAALADPEGRTLLIDSIALRRVVQPDAAATVVFHDRPSRFRAAIAAAAVLVALAAGYVVGERSSEPSVSEPPAATRVVEGAAAWQQGPAGGVR
jgi:hypothetical protein